MNEWEVSVIVFVCLVVGVLAGSIIREKLPEHHLRDDSKDVLKMGTGLIATLTALILGLLVSSAKNSFDSFNAGIVSGGAKIIALDRLLAQYGPETKEARLLLRQNVGCMIARNWPDDSAGLETLAQSDPTAAMEDLNAKLRALTPQGDSQKWLYGQALQMAGDMAALRWQMIEQAQNTLPVTLLVVLVFWLSVLFTSFGLFTARNATVVVVLLLCAASVACAIFLLLEMTLPFGGLIKVSSAPLLNAMSHLGK